ncbi:efflux transporter outer membrane subunit [Pirellulaceae bacterium]|nr:efflux transporter outer membrane subunit [Pirellulaceae bacterium]
MKSRRLRFAALLLLGLLNLNGCSSARYWWTNNKMVGPNYSEPAAPVAEQFSEVAEKDSLVVEEADQKDLRWWTVFDDPELNSMIEQLSGQNLSLQTAYYRIQEARHLRNIAAANLFPQSQTAKGIYNHRQNSRNSGGTFPGFPTTIDDWSTGFDASWEIDLWGRIRRSIAAAEAQVEVTQHDYDDVFVSIVGDAAALFVQIRSLDERIVLAGKNRKIQEGSLDIAEKRFNEGRTDKLDVYQAESNLNSTRALVPQFELARQQSLNALAVLLGVPPSEASTIMTPNGKIPQIPPQLVVGIPADLILQRPDILAAERAMARQFEQIGIAEAEFYPTFSISGSLGWQASKISNLLEAPSSTGVIAPGFRWNILNYGRLREGLFAEEARFKQIQYEFENRVLLAQREVEDGIIEFIKKNEQYQFDQATSQANDKSVELALASYREGKSDFGRVFVVQSNSVLAQDKVVETKVAIALALIKTYKALGGGWEINNASQ